MRFGSMVVFMVKWAIASIPALIILAMLGAVIWTGAIGLLSSPGRPSTRVPVSSSATTGTSNVDASDESGRLNADEVAYLAKVLVKDVSVGKSVLGETGIFGEVKNAGDRALKEVEITIYCLGPEGNPVFEKTYHPVLVSEFGFGRESSQPLKPGYSRTFGVKKDDAPSDWTKKVDVKVSKVRFQ
ncbi:MAG: hypothetical protein ACRD2Q_09855 [Terriglobales bacterium]